MTTKELIKAHNDLAAAHGLPPLQGWKASKEALQARIDGLMIREAEEADPLAIPEAVQAFGDAGPDQVPPSAAEDATDDHGEPTEARGGIGRMIEELLVDAEGYGYGEIVDLVRREFPKATTSRRSVASVAAALRRRGVEVPMRSRAKA